MSLEVYSRQSKAFQYDGYKINSEMREHINAEKSSSNVHKDRDTVNFSAEGRNMCYGFGMHGKERIWRKRRVLIDMRQVSAQDLASCSPQRYR